MLLGVPERRPERRPCRPRIFLVDDDRLRVRLSVAMLERIGARVFAGGSHAEALRLHEADPGLGLVVLDYEMPEDGHAVALVPRVRALRPEACWWGRAATCAARTSPHSEWTATSPGPGVPRTSSASSRA